jgi:hypothetical protein
MGSDVPHEQVVTSSIGQENLPFLGHCSMERLSISKALSAVFFERFSLDFLQLDSDSGDVCVMRASLEHWEHSKVNGFLVFLSVEDQSCSRPSQTLVRGCSNNIAELKWIT